MLKEFYSLLVIFNGLFTLYFVFPAILLLGIYLTFRLRCVQLSKLSLSFRHLFRKRERGEEGDISHYQAITSVLAGNFGTGNISGMAIALGTGGPGALIWMWVMAFLGAAIQYANCVLGAKYRKKNSVGEFVGGPMYYLRDRLGLKTLAVLFAIGVIFGAFAVGNFAQVNSMVLPLGHLGVPPFVMGIVMAFFIALVILGGVQRVAKVSSAVVPLMALLYLGAALVILGRHADQILPAMKIIFFSAFGRSEALLGGVLGLSVMKALTTGFDRAIFATDAGTGTVPILQAGTRTKDPISVGIVALVSPFMVMIVCTATALVLMITGAFMEPDLKSTNMVAYAFGVGVGKEVGPLIVVTALVLFGYTTT
ncbi:MAG: sodium:alanine symporter family protein, partial [Chlamydiia bacterium]|nr:sodium:alanine symporter family protein [Chlamydiia bacterium]